MRGIFQKKEHIFYDPKRCFKSVCKITLKWILKKWGTENLDWIQLASNEVRWCSLLWANQGVVMAGKCSTHVISEGFSQNFHPEASKEESMWKPRCGEGNIAVKHIYMIRLSTGTFWLMIGCSDGLLLYTDSWPAEEVLHSAKLLCALKLI
jgi:hypothetical protein